MPAPVVGLLYDEIYLKHDTGDHVENADRLVAIMDELRRSDLLSRLVALDGHLASPEELAIVHDPGYIDMLEEFAAAGGGWLNPDTFVSVDSFHAACHAAGSTLRSAVAVTNGEVDRAFVLVRPPGHHAVYAESMGFCLINNVAFATASLLAAGAAERVLLFDFDVHHGNGTQNCFYQDNRVLYVSVHQANHYPGTGAIKEMGSGPGYGYTVNAPLPAWSGDEDYERLLLEVLDPMARWFRPSIIIASAGYDAHWADPLSAMQLTVDGFALIVSRLCRLADDLCDGKLLLALEGGYHHNALAHGVRASLEVMLGDEPHPDPVGRSALILSHRLNVAEVIGVLKTIHGL